MLTPYNNAWRLSVQQCFQTANIHSFCITPDPCLPLILSGLSTRFSLSERCGHARVFASGVSENLILEFGVLSVGSSVLFCLWPPVWFVKDWGRYVSAGCVLRFLIGHPSEQFEAGFCSFACLMLVVPQTWFLLQQMGHKNLNNKQDRPTAVAFDLAFKLLNVTCW